jgi:hypothetical protein
MARRLRRLYEKGAARGNRAAVFAKVGDSITAAPEFLTRIAWRQRLGSGSALDSTIAFFSGETFPETHACASCAPGNSFTRQSSAAADGWTADVVVDSPPPPPPYGFDTGRQVFHPAPTIEPHESPLLSEVRALRPSLALVLLGTNDLWYRSLDSFVTSMVRIIDVLLEHSVIPLLSTIPPGHWRADEAPCADAWNAAIADLAGSNHVPLVNLWRAFTGSGMVNEGIDADLAHPSVVPGDGDSAVRAVNFTSSALRYGHNRRNFVTLQALTRLRRSLGLGDSRSRIPDGSSL